MNQPAIETQSKPRFHAVHLGIIDTQTATTVATAHPIHSSSPLIAAENYNNALNWAKIVASALNHYNTQQGGI